MAVRARDIIAPPRNDFRIVASETGLVPIKANPLIQPGPEDGLDRIATKCSYGSEAALKRAVGAPPAR